MNCLKCDKKRHAKGYCATHYMAYWRSQQPAKPDARLKKLVSMIRTQERKRIVRELEKLPIHLIRWEVIGYLEANK